MPVQKRQLNFKQISTKTNTCLEKAVNFQIILPKTNTCLEKVPR